MRPVFSYLFAGGTAAATNLAILYVCTEFFHVYYLFSAVIAFCIAFFVSFLLQKFFTFKNRATEHIHHQMFWYFVVSISSLGVNTLLLLFFVEVLHIWYLISAVITGGIIAIITFFLYRNVIFKERGNGEPLRIPPVRTLLTILGLGLAVFLASYKLTESPPTWLDEGIITQVAMNNAQHGLSTILQTAPGVTESAGYVSTSYPVTYPIAVSFSLFGVGLLQARVVMVLYLLGFVLAAFWLLKRDASPWQAVGGLLLIASFAPLYGNGKNVLGEVPGLLFLTLFLLWVKRIETEETTSLDFMGAGLMLGLTVVTKPIFLLLVPVVVIASLFSLQRCVVPKSVAAAVGFIAPVWLWLLVQFNGETLAYMLAVYANPHGNDLRSSVLHNALSFFTQPQPLYAALLLGVWLLSLIARLYKKQSVSYAEYIAAGFAALVYAVYLRGADYYRYFFLGEVLALMYLPKALAIFWPKRMHTFFLIGLISLFVLFQVYQSFFSSWAAEHYNAHRSRDIAALTEELGTKSIFVYQAPEVVPFLPTHNYYQYLSLLHVVVIGEENLKLLPRETFDIVIIPKENVQEVDLSKYALTKTLDRYSLWQKQVSIK